MRPSKSLPLILLTALTLGCSGSPKSGTASPPVISASAYDHTCGEVADCVAVYQGQVICCTLEIQCPNAVIRSTELERYQRDEKALETNCGTGTCPSRGDPCPGRLACTNGVCQLLGGK
jgi:hypothetical protein